MRIRPTYIRTRLTLWYVGIFSLVIVLYICVAYTIQYWAMNDDQLGGTRVSADGNH